MMNASPNEISTLLYVAGIRGQGFKDFQNWYYATYPPHEAEWHSGSDVSTIAKKWWKDNKSRY